MKMSTPRLERKDRRDAPEGPVQNGKGRRVHFALLALLFLATCFTLRAMPAPPSAAGDGQPAAASDRDEPFTATLGQDVPPSAEDPSLFDRPAGKGRRRGITPLGLAAPARDETGGLKAVTPITNTSNHYFSYNGSPVLLVGVSADNACHFLSSPSTQCGYTGNAYQTFINDARAQGLNKIRLWVSIVGGNGNTTTCAIDNSAVNDHPFTYDASILAPDGVGRWKLDSPNTAYFNRLFDVVNYANSLSPPMFVEVTLFSPLTGPLGLGPYSTTHAYLLNGTHLGGFSNTANFTNKNSAEYLAMKTYVFNVIHWTVDKLAAFPNVYYEVANEPENIQPSSGSPCGWVGASNQTDPATVSAWQAAIAAEIKSWETIHWVNTGTLTQNHLVAVEPSTTTAADTFVGAGINASAGSVVNSHYTVFRPKNTTVPNISGIGLGAVKMIRQYNAQPKIFGFNETKITGGACGGTNTGGTVDAGRAEAWEFMVNQGGTYDQFGYKCAPTTDYLETRRQIGVMLKFLTSPVNIVTKTRTSDPVSPNWINPEPYKTAQFNGALRYWAATEPTNNANVKRWLIYFHNSKDRNLVQDGYNAMVTSGGYQASLPGGTPFSVCLGAAAATYKVQYFNPKNAVNGAGVPTPIRPADTLIWPGAASCTPGGAGSMPLPGAVVSYDHDIAIFIAP